MTDINDIDQMALKQVKMDLTKEKLKLSQKLYNKAYYEQNKIQINKKLCKKTTCDLCERSIIANNLKKHKLSKICLK